MQSYYEVFMQSPRINRMVESGGATATDFRQVFKTNVQKRIRLLPEIDGMGKDNLIHSWLTKFDAIYFGEDESAVDGKRKRAKETAQSELILTKEQLYDMFQYILGIQRYEHQQLAQGCQVKIYRDNRCFIRVGLRSAEEILGDWRFLLARRSPGLGFSWACWAVSERTGFLRA